MLPKAYSCLLAGFVKKKKTSCRGTLELRFDFMKWNYKILVFACCLMAVPLLGQAPDSLETTSTISPPDSVSILQPIDSGKVKTKKRGFVKRIFKDNYPDPQMALYLSMAIPGGGQIYNKRWWKLPLVYGGYTALILAARFNTRNYRIFRDAYIAELAGDPHPFTDSGLDASDLKRIRDGYDKNKQLSYIGIFGLHLIQTAEAFVDAHLRSFDVSDDLSMRAAPKMGIAGDGSTYIGIGLSFRLSE